ncbi:hypothetical protein [Salinarimonas sp.]|uniref:hypothetical protein n=1 Tax=Salinarimonas sp. TaxID=2766526 RepID=UPI0032D97F50
MTTGVRARSALRVAAHGAGADLARLVGTLVAALVVGVLIVSTVMRLVLRRA